MSVSAIVTCPSLVTLALIAILNALPCRKDNRQGLRKRPQAEACATVQSFFAITVTESQAGACDTLSLQRVFEPGGSGVDQLAEFGLDLFDALLHLPGDLAVAEVPFDSAAHARNILD